MSIWPQTYAAQHQTHLLAIAGMYEPCARRTTEPRPYQMDIFPEQLADIIAEQ